MKHTIQLPLKVTLGGKDILEFDIEVGDLNLAPTTSVLKSLDDDLGSIQIEVVARMYLDRLMDDLIGLAMKYGSQPKTPDLMEIKCDKIRKENRDEFDWAGK